MKSKILQAAMISFLCLYPQINFAGGGGEPVEAPVYDELLNQISMREAEMLWQAGIPFYDVNTLEVWTQGYIPGAKFFNVRNWKKLLPENKDQTMVFYCVNKLCTASEMAAREVMKLGTPTCVRCRTALRAGSFPDARLKDLKEISFRLNQINPI